MDSGASKHFIGHHEILSNLVERESTHPVKGFGSVYFQLNYGETLHLHDVWYVSSELEEESCLHFCYGRQRV